MKEITAAWIQTNKEAYRADEKNSIYEKEYRKKIYQTLHLMKKKQSYRHLNFP